MRCDLHNIEDILSILEMESYIAGNKLAEEFSDFIADVIRYHTPAIKPYSGQFPINWHMYLFGHDVNQFRYGAFISSLANVQFSSVSPPPSGLWCEPVSTDVRYAIISLNYDMVIESYFSFMKAHFGMKAPIQICFNVDSAGGYFEGGGSISLAKIHGTLDPLHVVPPTWNKVHAPDVIPTWNLARVLISRANEIRFLGYSLPTTDTYMKYLLTAGFAAPDNYVNLKQIDVLCLDADGSVKARFDSLFDYRKFRFRNARVEDYFEAVVSPVRNQRGSWPDAQRFEIEAPHETFFRN
jgi:hypothetical protein